MDQLTQVVKTGDNYIFYCINNKVRCRGFDWIMPRITHLGGATFTVLCCLILLVIGDAELSLTACRASLALFIGFVTGYILKKMFTRPRPYLVLPGTFTGTKLFKDYAFPSGHTTAGFSLAVSFSLAYPILTVPLVCCAALIGISRVYLGQHYPSDVLAGSILGTTSALFITKLFLG